MENWVQTAMKQMQFYRDRDAVRKELWDHMMDRRLDFLEQGIALEDAEEAVLAVMGDPVEIGQQLNRIHQPWLGWLCLAAKWLVLLLSLVLCLCLLTVGGTEYWLKDVRTIFNLDPTCSQEQWFLSNNPGFSENSIPLQRGLSFRSGDYVFTVDHGFYYEEPWLENAPIQHFSVCLLVKADHFWQERPAVLEEMLTAEDDLGCRYGLAVPHTLRCQFTDAGLPVWKVNLQLSIYVEEGKLRDWVRFTVPETDLSVTVRTNGEVRQ